MVYPHHMGGRKDETMDENTVKRVPRMRTVSKLVAEIKALDPGSDVTEYYVRQLAKAGTVRTVWAGTKALIDMDEMLELLRTGTDRAQKEIPTAAGIRRVNKKLPAMNRMEATS